MEFGKDSLKLFRVGLHRKESFIILIRNLTSVYYIYFSDLGQGYLSALRRFRVEGGMVAYISFLREYRFVTVPIRNSGGRIYSLRSLRYGQGKK